MSAPEPLLMLYRGSLASCDHHCPYCPLQHRRDTRDTLRRDEAELDRFVDWVTRQRERPIGVLFTPWGEALIRPWYRRALVRLSHLDHVFRAVAQTNLSVLPHWVAEADPATLALWCTYHPGQTTQQRFLGSCQLLADHGVRFSVGVVGLRAHLRAAQELRAALPATVYVWINAEEGRGYSAAEEADWAAIDPWFGYSVRPHPSLGAACRTGESVFSVFGDGTVRRCHFVAPPLGNLYHGWLPTSAGDGQAAPNPPGCPNQVCDCHIGYVHMRELPLYELYGDGVLERIPCRTPAPWQALPDGQVCTSG